MKPDHRSDSTSPRTPGRWRTSPTVTGSRPHPERVPCRSPSPSRRCSRSTGRARHSEFWWFYLFTVIVNIVATGVDIAIFGGRMEDPAPISLALTLALLLPSLAVTVRRLHDIDRTGWWILIALIPIIGWIVLLVFHVSDSDSDNRFGISPKGYQGTVAV
nr:DUF805 domain-containing protein [uncultured Pseudokineococcus sp.]